MFRVILTMSAAHPRTASILGYHLLKTCEIIARCAPVLELITIKKEITPHQINTPKQLTAFRAEELTTTH